MQIICINNIFLNNFINYTFCSVFLVQEVFYKPSQHENIRKLIKFAFILMYFIDL